MASDSARTVLITGCSSGIGAHAAQGLKERGWRVLATARALDDVARLEAEGFESFRLDVADAESVAEGVAEVLEHTGGRLDALFNNAGYGQPGAVEDLRREVLERQFQTNLFGAHDMMRRVLPAMRRQGHGRIVQNSSVLGLVALRYRGAYNASKFALEGLTDTLRLELRGSGIHVSLVEPGPITSHFRENAHRAFRHYVDAEQSPHAEVYRAMERRLAKEGPAAPFTLGPEAVLRKVVHALESPRPKARYSVTFPTHLFAALRRVLPTPLLDAALVAVSRRG
jgi:NAD(P)-dependent dehydrogenase (short-subunit alcohol dehydrogenase family)